MLPHSDWPGTIQSPTWKSEHPCIALPAVSPESFNLRFRPHLECGHIPKKRVDVTIKYDTDAIRRAVRNIVLTNFYERPFKPSLGSSLRNQLFELNTDRKVRRLAKRVQKIIEDFEPRVENVKVLLGDVSDRNEMNVTIF